MIPLVWFGSCAIALIVAWFCFRRSDEDAPAVEENVLGRLERWNDRWMHPDSQGSPYVWDHRTKRYLEIDTVSEDAFVPEPERMVEIFKLDGVVYSVPRRVSQEFIREFLDIQDTKGIEQSIYFLLTKTLGPEAYDALKNHPNLTNRDLQKVVRRVEQTIL